MKKEFLQTLTDKYWSSLSMLDFTATFLDPILQPFHCVRNEKDREGFLKQVSECLHTLATESEKKVHHNTEKGEVQLKTTRDGKDSVAPLALSSEKAARGTEVTEVTKTEPPSKKAKLSPFDWFIKDGNVNKPKTDTVVVRPLKQRVNDDIKIYNAKCTYFTHEENDVFDPLSWWKEQALEFPVLSGIA